MEIAFAKTGGLVPAIVQDDRSGDVLMLGFMNEEALAETRRTRESGLLQPVAEPAVEEGRIQRACSESARGTGGLRRGRRSACAWSRSDLAYATKVTGVVSSAAWKTTAALR